MNKIIFSIVALLIAIFTIAGIYFSNISTKNKSDNKALSNLPHNTSLVIQFNNDKNFYEIFNNYEIFTALLGTEQVKNLVNLKNHFLNKTLREVAYAQNIFLIPTHSKQGMDCLWVLPIKSEQNIDLMTLLRNEKIQVEKLSAENYSLKINEIDKPIYVYFDEGIIAVSFSQNLINNYSNKNAKKIDPEFIDEINKGILKSPNSPLNVFFNNNSSLSFLNSFFRKPIEDLKFITPQNGFTNFNMNYKSDALLFSGTIHTDTSSKTYLNIFTRQKPLKNTIDLIATENTSSYINFSISNKALFDDDLKALLKSRNEYQQLKTQTSSTLKEAGNRAENDLHANFGNEFTTLKLANSENLGIIKVKNGERVKFILEPVSKLYSEEIKRLQVSNFLYLNYGDPFKKFSQPFYAVVDNYFICCNNPNVLQQYLNDYNAGRFLFKTEKNIVFDRLVSEQSAITAFIHLANSKYIINTTSKPYLRNLFKNKDYGLKDFYGISYQLSFAGGNFISNFYAGYKITTQDTVTTN